MPYARRYQYGTAHSRRPSAVATCSLETWALFRRGPGRAKACARPAGPKSRALETDASRLNRGLRIVIHLREGLVHHLASASTGEHLFADGLHDRAAQDALYHQLAKRRNRMLKHRKVVTL